ncbi:NAD(P)-binding protein [Xylariaceae sp. FL0255]|nr:NAD(P)-binding protein [Xylariaceae sp. FL0255]
MELTYTKNRNLAEGFLPVLTSHIDASSVPFFVDVGLRMDEVVPGISELVFPRSDLINGMYAFFHTHPHLDVEFRTSDLFSPLENERGWWVYRGRADNWIAMSNGLKMDPTETENAIASHPDVMDVLMAGSYRFSLCLLVELAEKAHVHRGESDDRRHDEIMEKLWPTIESANLKAPKFGRVPKELVLFATPERPFLRAGKGTVQRRLTIQAYEREINDLYSNVEEGLLTSGLNPPASLSIEDLMSFLEALCIETLLDDDSKTISVDDDLLALGLDSLSAFVLLARLKASFRKYGFGAEKIKVLDTKLLFSATTIRQLASALSGALSHQLVSPDAPRVDISELLKMPKAGVGTSIDQVVILTGSTGSLGSYVLSSLLPRPTTKRIFCLNRSSSPLETQISSFRSRGLADTALYDEERLKFLQVEPSAYHFGFGLPDDEYALLINEATHIIHNAYPVNFLLSVDAFLPQFDYLLNIMSLANESPHKPEIMFVSSITAATCVNDIASLSSSLAVSKESVLDRDVATKCLMDQGYARSKYVCESLLDQYASTTRNAASILRVGQVCGPVSGTRTRFWNPTEWLPSLVRSSKFLAAVPESLGTGMEVVDWVPVDQLGEIVCDILGAPETKRPSGAAGVFNIVHPAPVSWISLLPSVVTGIERATKKPVDVVPSSAWLQRLEESDQGSHVVNDNPAVKLLDFFRQIMIAEPGNGTKNSKVKISQTLNASKTARGLQPVNGADMAKWMNGWGL